MLLFGRKLLTDNIYTKISTERKEQQALGLLPEWYSSGGWQLFKSKYLYDAGSWKEQIERICRTAASYTDEPSYWEPKFFELFWEGWLSASTPVLANMGTDRGLPVSCSGQYIEDSIAGFYEALTETAVLSKNGFGTSGYLGDIRPRGTPVSVGGKASGVLPVLKDFVQCSRNVSQGSSRRGAWAGYLPIEHGDFWEVAGHIEAYPDDLNIGWIITDSFISKLDNGDDDAIHRFQTVMKIKATLGKGYFQFIDKCNRHRPQWYVDNKLDIKASQLCVAPETLVLTREGYQPIADLEDEVLDIWNGKEWSEVTVKKTGENQKLLRVITNSGFELECTPYHKFYIAMRHPTSGNRWVVQKRAHELKAGDKIIKSSFPIIEGSVELENAYENGLYSAEGFVDRGQQKIYFYHEKRKLKEFVDESIFTNWYVQESENREIATSRVLRKKFFVPSGDFTIASKLRWFAGLCDGDGTIARNGKTQSIQVGNVNKEFLLETQMMLQTLGVSSKVTKSRDACWAMLPANDGSGKNKEYWTQDSYRLLIGQTGICTLTELGFNPHRLIITNHTPNRECDHFVKITEVVDEGRYDDTYCFTEVKQGMGIFNGILTGQCSEIVLHSSKDFTYTCVLSSMVVSRYDEWKDTDAVFTATVFLDCVASDFIEKAKEIRHLEKAVEFTRKSRALGLGQMGLFSLFQKRKVRPDSFDAHMLNIEIAKHIDVESERATKWMAEKWGEPEWCKGYGVRNSHRCALAPTKSTSLLSGGWSEGINPDPAMAFSSSGAAGDIDRVNPVLLELIKEKGLSVKRCTDQILADGGSVQQVDWLTDEEKSWFLTAFEIDQHVLIRYAAARQKYVDQGQSTNLFFAHDDDEGYIAKVHQEAFLNEDILTLYYIYSSSEIKAERTGVCEACQ